MRPLQCLQRKRCHRAEREEFVNRTHRTKYNHELSIDTIAKQTLQLFSHVNRHNYNKTLQPSPHTHTQPCHSNQFILFLRRSYTVRKRMFLFQSSSGTWVKSTCTGHSTLCLSMQFITHQYTETFNFHSLICGVSNSVYSTDQYFGVIRPKEMEEEYQNNHRVKVEGEETKTLHTLQKDRRLTTDTIRV